MDYYYSADAQPNNTPVHSATGMEQLSDCDQSHCGLPRQKLFSHFSLTGESLIWSKMANDLCIKIYDRQNTIRSDIFCSEV